MNDQIHELKKDPTNFYFINHHYYFVGMIDPTYKSKKKQNHNELEILRSRTHFTHHKLGALIWL